MRPYHALIVDDDPLILKTLSPVVADHGLYVTAVPSGEKALAALAASSFDLVFTDIVMEAVDGIRVLQMAKSADPETVVVILTGYPRLSSAIDAVKHGADDYLIKPCGADAISDTLSTCVEKLEFRRRLRLSHRIVPICSQCGRIRDDTGRALGTGRWVSVESFLWKRGGAEPSHTLCPTCLAVFSRQIDGTRGARVRRRRDQADTENN